MLGKMPRRRTKIVATIGPSSAERSVVRAMIEAGMNVARLNFSHGTHEEHARVLQLVREESQAAGAHVAVFQDLCGPKVRIGEVEGGEVHITEGDNITLRHADGRQGTARELFVEAFNPTLVMYPGHKAFLADGRIELVARRIDKDGVLCEVRAGGLLRSRSGIAVPDSTLQLPCLTEKDLKDLEWGVHNELDYIALSFVASPRDVTTLREKIRQLGGDIPIIAKIERASSLDHIGTIVETADAVMVARGDLGLELPLEKVPSAQKTIIEAANFIGTPVITATQMLVSMVHEVRPTRAEVSDVSTAVRDGTDAVMLSEETAIGRHPVRAIEMLDRIIVEAEKELQFESVRPKLRSADGKRVADAVCFAACSAAEKVAATAILACTVSGHTARLMAKYRPQRILFATTSEQRTLNRLAPLWGIEPVLIELSEDASNEDEVMVAMTTVRDKYGIKPGSRVVVTAGLRARRSGSTALMEIREIPRA